MNCPVTNKYAEKLAFDFETSMKTKTSMESPIACDFKTAEKVRNYLIEKGFKVLLFNELKKLSIAIWK